jgi:RimJ/RimL family protein N-acetyltransferase
MGDEEGVKVSSLITHQPFRNAIMQTNLHEILPWLEQDVFKNIVLLKMLHAYPAGIHCYRTGAEQTTGVLLLLPTQSFYFDAHTYPQTRFVVLLSTADATATQSLLSYIPTDCNLVFKLMSAHDQAVLAQRFPLQRTMAFISFTAPPGSHYDPPADVVVATQPDEACLEIYEQQGHTRSNVESAFDHGAAFACTLYAVEHPLATCFAYQNYGPVWEIGGVYTAPAARRQGHGASVVTAALHTLLKEQRIPRYQVHEQNEPSIRLAQALGLTPFVTIEHFLSIGS